MRAEYKRDLNHNYLVLYGEEEIDTSSYQVRMLVGNVIPSLLKCRIQGMDGKFAVYYDITSRQSLAAFYENRKLGQEDLKMIFGEVVRVLEDAAEYLMNPGQLVLMPEYMFLEIEKKEISFCFLPGYPKDIKEQLQTFTEYILPNINHEDEKAVIIGYGVYRRALEESFHLEHIKEELYRTRDSENIKKNAVSVGSWKSDEESQMELLNSFGMSGEMFSSDTDDSIWKERNISGREYRSEKLIYGNKTKTDQKKSDKIKSEHRIWKKIAGISTCSLVFLGILTAKMMGYLPEIELFMVIGATLVCMGTGMLVYIIARKVKKNREQEESGDTERKLRREQAREEREFMKRQEPEEVQSHQFIAGNMDAEEAVKNCGETVILSMNAAGPSSLVSKEPGELATIYLEKELTIIGKLKTASDAVIDLPTVSRVHAKIRKREDGYYLTDLNSRNGTMVNGRLLKAEEEYCLQNEDEVDFAQARYIFLE